jgi:hypothetical protein
MRDKDVTEWIIDGSNSVIMHLAEKCSRAGKLNCALA